MDQPEVSIDAVLQQAEEYRLRREVRDPRPDEITTFISQIAELFEPFVGVGRVGFDCYPAAHDWVVSVFLGSTEVVGGRDDGLRQHAGFHFDIHTAMSLFGDVNSVRFTSHPTREAEGNTSGITIVGTVDTYSVRLIVHSVPPENTGPALRRMPDRSLHLTD